MNNLKNPLSVGYEYITDKSSKVIDEAFDWIFAKANPFFGLSNQLITTVSGTGP